MSYAVIQSPSATPNSKLWAIVNLQHGAYVSPAGYVVGNYVIIKDNFKHKLIADTLCKDFNGELL